MFSVGQVAGPQAVIGNPFTEVVDAVEGDVRPKPIQQRMNIQIAAPFQRTPQVVPTFAATGIGAFKIVLHKKYAQEKKSAKLFASSPVTKGVFLPYMYLYTYNI